MNLAELELKNGDTSVMTVKDPRDPSRLAPLVDGDGTPMTITMLSMDCEQARDANRRIRAKRLLDRNPIVTVNDAVSSLRTAELSDIELVASAATAWSGIGLDEPETKFSTGKVIEAYTRLPWLFEQANLFLGNRANFMKASRSA